MVFIINSKIFPNFPGNFEPEPEDNTCPICDLVEAYLHEITLADSREEIEYLLHGLAEGSFQDGYTTALQDDIEIKSELLSNTYRNL